MIIAQKVINQNVVASMLQFYQENQENPELVIEMTIAKFLESIVGNVVEWSDVIINDLGKFSLGKWSGNHPTYWDDSIKTKYRLKFTCDRKLNDKITEELTGGVTSEQESIEASHVTGELNAVESKSLDAEHGQEHDLQWQDGWTDSWPWGHTEWTERPVLSDEQSQSEEVSS